MCQMNSFVRCILLLSVLILLVDGKKRKKNKNRHDARPHQNNGHHGNNNHHNGKKQKKESNDGGNWWDPLGWDSSWDSSLNTVWNGNWDLGGDDNKDDNRNDHKDDKKDDNWGMSNWLDLEFNEIWDWDDDDWLDMDYNEIWDWDDDDWSNMDYNEIWDWDDDDWSDMDYIEMWDWDDDDWQEYFRDIENGFTDYWSPLSLLDDDRDDWDDWDDRDDDATITNNETAGENAALIIAGNKNTNKESTEMEQHNDETQALDTFHSNEAELNVETLRKILELMEQNRVNLPKHEEYTLQTLRDLVETMSMADSFFDTNRGWVCDVFKSKQMLNILKEILKNDNKFLNSLKDTQEERAADQLYNNVETEAETETETEAETEAEAKTEAETENPVEDEDLTAADDAIFNDIIIPENTDIMLTEDDMMTENEHTTNNVEEKGIASEDTKEFSFQIIGITTEKQLPEGPNKSESESESERFERSAAFDGGSLPVVQQSPVRFNEMQITEILKYPEEEENIEYVEEEEAESIIDEGIVKEIMYKKMFFSFLGKMCGIIILPED